MGRRIAAGVLWAILLFVIMAALPAQGHTRTELDLFVEEWTARADEALSFRLVSELQDMEERHPWYFNPTPASRVVDASGWSGSVEQWRPLISIFFATDQVDTAMRVMNCETGGTGNPDSYNQRSGASGLFQHLPKYWVERSKAAGWGGADIFDPEANVAVAAWLARRSWLHWTCY
jgi:hypothetical protein